MSSTKIGIVFIEKTEHWTIRRTIVGLNGAGGAWIREEWAWPDGKACRESSRSLTREETLALIAGVGKGSEPAPRPVEIEDHDAFAKWSLEQMQEIPEKND